MWAGCQWGQTQMPTLTAMTDFWPSAGWPLLRTDEQGWLIPTDGWLRRFLEGPELALVQASCAAERRLHNALRENPRLAVAEPRLQTLADADAADNYRAFLAFRDALDAAGSLEACYLQQVRSARVSLAPPFMQAMAQAIVRHLLRDNDDAMQARAAELLFRPQRVRVVDGVTLAGHGQASDPVSDTHLTLANSFPVLRRDVAGSIVYITNINK